MIAIISFTDKGKSLAKNIAEKYCALGFECSVSSAKKDLSENYVKTEEWVCKNFKSGNFLLFIGACGIAVRAIAPFVKDKASDPAVVVMDEAANFAIPILSGHLGGANDFARKLSELTGAQPVITTATDVNNLFSVDSFAKENSMKISDMLLAKEFSARLLKEKKCKVLLPDEIFDCLKIDGAIPKELDFAKTSEAGKSMLKVIVSPFKNEEDKSVLRLFPRCIVLGGGCRKGKDPKEFKDFILRELNKISLDMNSIAALCSIDLKRDEEALLSFSKDYDIPLRFFSSEELSAVKGEFSTSNFVKEVTGVDNVCERSLFAYGAKKIILKKCKNDGMTLAVGCTEIALHFNSRTVRDE